MVTVIEDAQYLDNATLTFSSVRLRLISCNGVVGSRSQQDHESTYNANYNECGNIPATVNIQLGFWAGIWIHRAIANA